MKIKEEFMGFIRRLANVVDYGLTAGEAIGLMQRKPLLKYGVAVVKSLSSVHQDHSLENVSKEIGQNGVSILCDICGYATGEQQLAAQVELLSKATLDAATWSVSEARGSQRRHRYPNNF